MKISGVLLGLSVLSIVEEALAYPGMANTIEQIKQRSLQKRSTLSYRRANYAYPRQEPADPDDGDDDPNDDDPNDNDPGDNDPDDDDDGSVPPVLIGDVKDGGTTIIGQTIARILLKKESGESLEAGYKAPGPPGSTKCKADTCCIWSHISAELSVLFRGPSGRCNRFARAAVRLGFHDAGTWSQVLADAGQDFGGADGSIALSPNEIKRPENNGLQDIVVKVKALHSKYRVGMADLIQFAAKHAVVTCPLGPRIRSFVGRKDSSVDALDGLLPDVNDSADNLIKLFEDKTIPPHDLVALLGAHSTSEQFFVDPTRKGAPQDGTPGVWDTLFYNQTLGTGPLPKEVFRFPSDIVLSKDPRTKVEWESFSGPDGQHHWNEDYSYSYIRLSLLGVNNINNLTECTKVLPLPRPYFQGAGVLLKNE